MFVRPFAATTLILAASLAAPSASEAQDLLGGSGPAAGDWSGPYVGITAGAVRSTGEAVLGDYEGALLELDVRNGLFPDTIDGPDTAAAGGVTVGFNVARDAFVGGVELDYAFGGPDAAAAFSRVDPNPDPMFNGVHTNTGYETALDGLATLRLRAGRDFGGTLVYATGGLAMGQVENRFTLALPELGYTSPGWSEEGTRMGYAVGLGVERRLSTRVSLKAEVLRYDLDDATVEARDPVTFPGQAIDYRFDNAGTVARIGVNVRF